MLGSLKGALFLVIRKGHFERVMEQDKTSKRIRASLPTILVFGIAVFAFMGLSLAITATGTARFAAAIGYSPIVGYVVGAIVDIAKDVLLESSPSGPNVHCAFQPSYALPG
jgi:hypothetical protein